MKRPILHPMRLICALMLACSLSSCGLTAYASEAQQPEPIIALGSENMLYPDDVQHIDNDTDRQIVKTYTLSAEENPDHIPRASFELDGWLYELTDIKQSRTSAADARPHIETVEIETDSNDLNEIIEQLSTTLEHESEDGYCGLLTLDLASVKCEAVGYESSSYAVTVTREYGSLPSNDLYFIRKTVTDNGRTLALDSVEWQAQTFVNVGYTDIPDSYRAIAKYTGKALQSIVTGYVTTADYTGDITKTVGGDTVYTVFFAGSEITPAPENPEVTPATDSGSIPIVPIIGIALIIVCAGAAAFFFLRHNVKVCSVGDDGHRVLVAKVRISAKNLTVDLTPLADRSESQHFRLEIDKLAAKSLNDTMLDVVFASARLQHKIAFEGNAYKIEVNFRDETIKAIY